MKHLKVKARLLPDNKHFMLTVLEQSSILESFSPKSVNTQIFVHGDIALASYRYGEGVHETGGTISLVGGETCLFLVYLNNDVTRVKVKIPTKFYPQIKAAIEAYNEYYKD